ncbi:MAG: hypothetical protein HYY18_12755 [Planctomycetes bacterium]|nr:hypothetical protein [Planctomycetota bacterium]
MRLRAASVVLPLLLQLAAIAQTTSDEKEIQAAWASFSKSVEEEDKAAIWNFFSADAKTELQTEERMEAISKLLASPDSRLQPIAEELGITILELKKLPAAELYQALVITNFIHMKEPFRSSRVSCSMMSVKEAVVTLEWIDKDKAAHVARYLLSSDGKAWKLSGRHFREESLANHCTNRLKHVSVYISLFESKARRYPEDLAQLKAPTLIQEDMEKILACPFGEPGVSPFVYLYPLEGELAPWDTITLYDSRAHPDGMLNVADLVGKVTRMTPDAFHERLRKDLTRLRPKIGPALEAAKAQLQGASEADKPVVQARVAALRSLSELAESELGDSEAPPK